MYYLLQLEGISLMHRVELGVDCMSHSLTVCKQHTANIPQMYHMAPAHLGPTRFLRRHSDGVYRGRVGKRVSLCCPCFSFRSHCLTKPETIAHSDAQQGMAIRHLKRPTEKAVLNVLYN